MTVSGEIIKSFTKWKIELVWAIAFDFAVAECVPLIVFTQLLVVVAVL